MTTPIAAIKLSFTQITVLDWVGMVRWYVETVGLRLVVEDSEHEYALMDAGTGRIALKGGGSSGLLRDGVRLVFEVPDIDVERDRLARLDVAVGPTEASREGYRAIRLRDPEGTPITLFCWETPEKLPPSGV